MFSCDKKKFTKSQIIMGTLSLIIIVAVALFVLFGSIYTRKNGTIGSGQIREYETYGYTVFADENVPLSNGESPHPEDIWYNACVDMFNQINSYRIANGLKAYVWSENMYNDAQIRVREATVNWSHTRPDGTPWYSVDMAYNYGECLAKNYKDNNAALKGWQTSPSHNAILLRKDLTTAGVGICTTNSGMLYWALEVGIG